jgi:O-antigen ligase
LIRQLAVLALAVVYDLWSEAVAGIVAIVGHVVAVLVVIGLSATLLSVRQNRSRAVDAYTSGRDSVEWQDTQTGVCTRFSTVLL